MSFKRDGDDANLLKNLQHRRVSEILGDHIPDDEALLLSNGRLDLNPYYYISTFV